MLRIKKGDEVIVPAMTFIASVSPLVHLGIKPVLVDIEKENTVINSSLIENAITKKTKAIIGVHLHGYMCDMDKLRKISKRHSLFLIEDACQAHGSSYRDKMAGSFGDAAFFSFYPSKNLGAYGDGGAIVTSSTKLAKKIRLLRNHGQKSKYNHVVLGLNSRLDNMQAAILRYKLQTLSYENMKRTRVAKRYNDLLSNTPLMLPSSQKDCINNYHIYSVRTRQRNKLLKYLQSYNIQCGIHYPQAIHQIPFLKPLGNDENFPEATKSLSLPMYPSLKNKEIAFITEKIKHFFLNKE